MENFETNTAYPPSSRWTSVAPSCHVPFSSHHGEPAGSPWFWCTLCTPSPLVKGSPYRAGSAMISDWGYVRDGRMYGNYTTRVMLKRIPAEQAEGLRKILSPQP